MVVQYADEMRNFTDDLTLVRIRLVMLVRMWKIIVSKIEFQRDVSGAS